MSPPEKWQLCADFPGYQVSSLGRLKGKRGMILDPGKNKEGYIVAFFGSGKNKKTIQVHREVAKAFIPNPDNKKEVHHINTIRHDNKVKNLQWVTHTENQRAKTGPAPGGNRRAVAEFTLDWVYVRQWESVTAAANAKEISETSLSEYLRDKTGRREQCAGACWIFWDEYQGDFQGEEWKSIPNPRNPSAAQIVVSTHGRFKGPRGIVTGAKVKGDYLIYRKTLAHRLVALAWIPNPDSEKNVVNHIDGVPSNNRKDNLEWVTQKENVNHASAIGLINHRHGKQSRPIWRIGKNNGPKRLFLSLKAAVIDTPNSNQKGISTAARKGGIHLHANYNWKYATNEDLDTHNEKQKIREVQILTLEEKASIELLLAEVLNEDAIARSLLPDPEVEAFLAEMLIEDDKIPVQSVPVSEPDHETYICGLLGVERIQ
jgi:hypothetical protein